MASLRSSDSKSSATASIAVFPPIAVRRTITVSESGTVTVTPYNSAGRALARIELDPRQETMDFIAALEDAAERGQRIARRPAHERRG